MKHPAFVCVSLLVFSLASGCSDESTFAGSAASIPVPPVVPAEVTPPGADAKQEIVPEEEPIVTIPAEGEDMEIPAVVETEKEVTTLPDSQLVTKVGVNFEDQPGTDADYNDAVLCFKGGFEVSPTIIQATKKQTVEAVLFSEAQCTNNIIVKVMRGTTVVSSVTYNPKITQAATLEFEKGDRLDVSLVSTDCAPGQIRSMTDKLYTELSPDVCNVQ